MGFEVSVWGTQRDYIVKLLGTSRSARTTLLRSASRCRSAGGMPIQIYERTRCRQIHARRGTDCIQLGHEEPHYEAIAHLPDVRQSR